MFNTTCFLILCLINKYKNESIYYYSILFLFNFKIDMIFYILYYMVLGTLFRCVYCTKEVAKRITMAV